MAMVESVAVIDQDSNRKSELVETKIKKIAKLLQMKLCKEQKSTEMDSTVKGFFYLCPILWFHLCETSLSVDLHCLHWIFISCNIHQKISK